jgi:hypothetical protein
LKITKAQLKQIIKEEVIRILEADVISMEERHALKLVAQDGEIIDTPPEPPVEVPDDPEELKKTAIETVVGQLRKIGRAIFSNEMRSVLKKRDDEEEQSFWQKRKQYDADMDYISDHKGESPFKELWQQLNVEAALS